MHRGAFALKTLCIAVAAVIVASAPSFAQTPRVFVSGSNSATASGVVAGAHGGYNWQNGPAVYGFEADFSAADLNSSMSGGLSCPIVPCSSFFQAADTSSKIHWYGTVRGRLGWAAGPVLLYGTGGLAYGKVDLASSFSVENLSVSAQATSVKTGWVAGGGIEYMVQPNVALSLGYQYLDLGTVSLASLPSNTACCTGFLTQDASIRARFQTVTLGLSWKFAPADAARASKSWEGGYLGGQIGGAWGVNTIADYFAFFFSCFTATTPVLMADGTSRPIAAVKIGDAVLGENGAVNRVVAIETPALGSRKLYAFNGGPAFVTPEHPFMTRAGWKSIAPEATFAENNSFPVGALQVGDELVRLETVTTRAKPVSVAFGGTMQASSVEVLVDTKLSPLESMVPQDGDPFMTVYNLRLDGNHTYFANNYLVHNK
jgi:outer membrane immunogenic protein